MLLFMGKKAKQVDMGFILNRMSFLSKINDSLLYKRKEEIHRSLCLSVLRAKPERGIMQ